MILEHLHQVPPRHLIHQVVMKMEENQRRNQSQRGLREGRRRIGSTTGERRRRVTAAVGKRATALCRSLDSLATARRPSLLARRKRQEDRSCFLLFIDVFPWSAELAFVCALY